MSVQRCEACGGLFAHLPRGVCASCLDQRERDFRDVRDWLRDNGGAGIAEAAAATGVEEGVIVRFIREGRIEVVDPADPALLRDREDEERRAELVRRLADAPHLGTSLNTDIGDAGRGPVPTDHPSRGMRTRRA